MRKSTLIVQFQHDGDDTWQSVGGRDAWALQQLVAAGNNGITTLQNPAPRMSAYIHNLRNLGVLIDTVHEPHAGPFPGVHGRYILRSSLKIREQDIA